MTPRKDTPKSRPRSTRCNLCGKFRRREDVISVDYSDECPLPLVDECLTCTAPANLGHGDV